MKKFGINRKNSEDVTMKLLTINVHSWLEENQLEKLNILAKTIVEKKYDVIAMQEVNQLISSELIELGIREDNFGKLLLDKINEYGEQGYKYYWTYSHIGFDKFEEGLAILAKGDVVAVEDFYCTTQQTVTSIESRKILKVDLKINDEIVEFYSCHMNLPTCKGEDIEQNLYNLVNYTDNTNLKIFMGDFNTDYFNQVDEYKAILEQGLFDTYEMALKKDKGVTVYKNISGWEDSMCQKKLDYIFSNKKLNVEESYVIFNNVNYPIISDHNGLEVTLAEK